MMKTRHSAKTDVGRKRNHNEDSHAASPETGLFIVCDGMGGHAAGEVASRMSVETVAAHVGASRAELERLASGGPEERRGAREKIAAIVQAANARVNETAQSDPTKRGMGTTLTMIVFVGGRALVGHVGDSRLYLLRGEQVHQVTADHTVINKMIQSGQLKPEDAKTAPYQNALTRAIGVYPSVEVETHEIDVLPGDLFLLCSDGLHGYMDGFDLGTYLSHVTLESAAEDLVAFANKSGGKDNITAIVVKVAESQETRETLRIRLTLQTLRQIPLFAYLSFAEQLRVIQVCRVVEKQAGEPIIRAGESGDELFIVLEGRVRVHQGGTEVAVLRAGSHFGEMSLVDNHPRSADVTAVDETVLIRITRDDFYRIMREDSVMAVKLLWNLIQAISMVVRRTNAEREASDSMVEVTDEVPRPY